MCFSFNTRCFVVVQENKYAINIGEIRLCTFYSLEVALCGNIVECQCIKHDVQCTLHVYKNAMNEHAEDKIQESS